MRFAYMPDTHFGVYEQPPPSPEEAARAFEHLIDEAVLAEEVGFDAVFLPERHGRTETFAPSPLTVATAIAARTDRIKIATTVMLPPLYSPVHLAEQVAMIDNLSRGRFVFGAGVGYHQGYHQTFGVPWRRRGRRFEEAMEVIVLALTQERFSFDGEFFNYEDVCLSPKPYQRPRPPIWIGAHAEGKPVDRALDYEGWVLWTLPEWEDTASWIEQMRARAAERGKSDWTVVLDQDGWLGDDPAEVRARHSPRWLREARSTASTTSQPRSTRAGTSSRRRGRRRRCATSSHARCTSALPTRGWSASPPCATGWDPTTSTSACAAHRQSTDRRTPPMTSSSSASGASERRSFRGCADGA